MCKNGGLSLLNNVSSASHRVSFSTILWSLNSLWFPWRCVNQRRQTQHRIKSHNKQTEIVHLAHTLPVFLLPGQPGSVHVCLLFTHLTHKRDNYISKINIRCVVINHNLLSQVTLLLQLRRVKQVLTRWCGPINPTVILFTSQAKDTDVQ